MSKITIIITVFNANHKQIDYWTKIYFSVRDKIPFHWIIDNPDFKFDSKISESDIFYNEKNIGKLSSIYNHIKSGKVKTPYFKSVDPDDFISIKGLKNFSFPNNDNSIITFNSTKEIGLQCLDQEMVEKKIEELSKTIHMIPSYGTSYTILPTKMLEKDVFFSKRRIDADEDQILGYLCHANGGTFVNNTSSFYLYSKFVGQTSPENFGKLIFDLEAAYEEYDNIHNLSGVKFGHNFKSIQNHIFNLKIEFEKINGKLSDSAEQVFQFTQKERNL